MGVGVKRYKDPKTGEWKSRFICDSEISHSPLMHILFCSWAGHKWHTDWSSVSGFCKCCRYRGDTGSAWEISERLKLQNERKRQNKWVRHVFVYPFIIVFTTLYVLSYITQYFQPM